MSNKKIEENTIEDRTRRRISAFLPDALAKALTSYHLFADREFSVEKPKEFSDHHSACKVAIAHIELLIKLAKWAELPDARAKDGNQQIILATMMQEAQDELNDYREKQSGEEEKPCP